MRTLSLVALCLSLPLSAYAEVKSVDSLALGTAPDSAIFRKLEFLFNTGTVPYFPPARILGFSGRCFDRAHEDAVKGAAYLVSDHGTRNGPIGDGLMILSIWSDHLTEYDRMCTSDITRAEVSWNPACVANGSLTAFVDSMTGSFLRANGDFYIEKIANHEGEGASHFCYYYRAMDP